jgi:hypothetical protein
METKDHKDFWMDASIGRKLTPIFAVGSRQGDKLFGVGNDIFSSSILVFQKEGRKPVNKNPSHFANDINDWLCAEVSFNEDIIFVGGVHGSWAVIGAISFDEELKSINFSKLTNGDFRCLTRLRRIKGSDLLLAGCFGSIMVIHFKESKFNIINSYMYLCNDAINSIVFYSSYIFYITSDATELGILEFEKRINQKEFNFKEKMKAIEQKNQETEELEEEKPEEPQEQSVGL